MDDLSMLAPDVREAVERTDCTVEMFDTLVTVDRDDWDAILVGLVRLARNNRILEIKNAGTLANNLCPDHRDKQTGKICLACTIERAESENASFRRAFTDLSAKHLAVERELEKLRARIANSVHADAQRVLAALGLPVMFDGTFALVKLEDGE